MCVCVGYDILLIRLYGSSRNLPPSRDFLLGSGIRFGKRTRNTLLYLLSLVLKETTVTKDPRVHTSEFWRESRLLVDFEAGEDEDDSSGGGNSWREELQRRYQQENDFLAELRARNANMPQTPSTTLSSEQDEERGEREEAEGEKEDDDESNWAEAVKRWVNR